MQISIFTLSTSNVVQQVTLVCLDSVALIADAQAMLVSLTFLASLMAHIYFLPFKSTYVRVFVLEANKCDTGMVAG